MTLKNWIAAALAVAGLPVLAAPWAMPDLGEHIAKTNVTVNKGCSGTVVDAERGLILTAAHCKKEAQVIEMRVYDGAEVSHQTITPAEVVAEDPANDLLLLRVAARLPFSMEATLYEGDVPVGSDVWLVGNPMARFDNSVSKGVLGSKHEKQTYGAMKNINVWVIDARAIGGNSGGAAYVDGRLIGVLSGGVSQMTAIGGHVPIGVNFIIPLPTVAAFLAGYEAD